MVGIATRYGLEGPGIESRWGEIFRTYSGRRPGRDADHTPSSSAEVKKKLSYTSTHPIVPPGPVTGFSSLCQILLSQNNSDV